MKVVLLESLGISDELLKSYLETVRKMGHEIEAYERTSDEEKLVEEIGDADVAIIANMPLPGSVIEKAPNLKYIDVAFTGLDHVGLEACEKRGIKVTNASGYSNVAVSELAISMSLDLLRNIPAVSKRTIEGKTKEGLIGNELYGKTVGIIGLGAIGSRSAKLFNAFGAHVLGVEGHSLEADIKDFVELLPKEEVYQKSDIVVLHVPLNENTRGMVGKQELSLMKKSAILINLARGGVIKTDDLVECLENRGIRAAGIDVFDVEPPLPKYYPLLKLDNVLLTPHVAFATEESMVKRAEIIFSNLINYLS